jgi:two-component system cell cycle sensor histidine kinase PleC
MDLLRRLAAAVSVIFATPLRSRAARDLALIALFSVGVFALCAAFDFNERLMLWLLAHDKFGLEELPLVVLAAALGLGWYAIRRWREYRVELRHRQMLEKKYRLAAEEAEIANRAKSEFLANMSHDLRTPLNGILGFSEALAGGYFGPMSPRQSEYVRDIHASGHHLLQLINEVLDMAKLDAGRMTLSEEVVDVARVIDDSVRLVRHRAQASGIALAVEPTPAAMQLRADELRLKQILLNLASNAVKFTPAQGRVTIRAGYHRDGAPFIEVADTGIGMRQADVAVALTPFAQVENFMTRKHEGTGLGLPIVSALVELHGGRLLIGSKPGAGTTVTVVFPRERAVREAANQAA